MEKPKNNYIVQFGKFQIKEILTSYALRILKPQEEVHRELFRFEELGQNQA